MQVKLIDLIGVLSRALDLVSSTLGNHHQHVGCLSARMAARMGLDAAVQRDVLIAAMLHDAGAIALHTRLEDLAFEKDMFTHARAGRLLFEKCTGLEAVAHMVGEHHTPWTVLRRHADATAAAGASITNCADFIDTRLRRHKPYAQQFGLVLDALRTASGGLLNPACVAIFAEMVESPESLDGLFEPGSNLYTDTDEKLEQVVLGSEDIVRFCSPIAQVIDFRSRFTATHSRGVAVVAASLAGVLGVSEEDRRTMYVAGLLHDIGKLAVHNSLLEKNGALDDTEFAEVQSHARVSEQILGHVKGLEQVCEWASQHHERLDGTGYPHGHTVQQLSQGARILQVADVFTAIMEDRPYRAGMTLQEASAVLLEQADKGLLATEVVHALLAHVELVNRTRAVEQQRAQNEFEQFSAAVRGLDG